VNPCLCGYLFVDFSLQKELQELLSFKGSPENDKKSGPYSPSSEFPLGTITEDGPSESVMEIHTE